MENKISIQSIIKELKTNDFVLNCAMPMGYVAGLPILQIANEQLCLKVPYLKYRVTGEVDKTLVYPIRYTVTLVLPEKRVSGFQDLSLDSAFAAVDFGAPIGLFRHEAIRNLNKAEYNALRDELFAQYDKVVDALLNDAEYGEDDEIRMRELLQQLLEPSLLPIYKALDADFFEKYLN